MKERTPFLRKLAYVVAMVLLLMPVAWLGAPAARRSANAPGSPGGWLARMRDDAGLSQANLGEIDPASEAIKLATLGMRGIAANLLWEKANHYKKTEDWTNLSATLEQITKLQPNFISVWRFQAWNLSYNVSAEFDDYHDRYYWVMRGVDFLKEGEEYNRDDPRILRDIGWFISQKIGRSDEHRYFRRLFKQDDDFHPPDRLPAQRDNWLVGKLWFRRAERVVDEKGTQLRAGGRGTSDLIFFANAPMCQINYAEAIEKEGTLDDVARRAWQRAENEWTEDYGNRRLKHAQGEIVLNELDRLQREQEQLEQQLDALVPGLRAELVAEREADLSDAQREALDTPSDQLSDEQYVALREAREWLSVSNDDLVQRLREVAPDKAAEAERLASAARRNAARIGRTRRYRNIVNYDYWNTRCQFEQTPEALRARRMIFEGDEQWQDADLVEAKRLYDQGFAAWGEVMDAFPSVIDDPTTGDDLMDVIRRYRRILDELDEPFPKDFELRDVIQYHDDKGEFGDVLNGGSGGGRQNPASDP